MVPPLSSLRRRAYGSGLRLRRAYGSGLRLRGGFHLLLVRPDFFQRPLVDHIGDRHVGAVLAVITGRLAPSSGGDAVLLAQQRQKDLGLLLTETGQRLQSSEHLGAVGIAVEPQLGGVTVVAVDD